MSVDTMPRQASSAPPANRPWLKPREAAAHIGYELGSLYHLTSRARRGLAIHPIPRHYVNGRLRFLAEELDEWVRTGGAGGTDRNEEDPEGVPGKK